MNKYLEPFVPLVDFIADYLGEHAEVVLHDLTDLEHSIVKIRNGYISGRREGDPCTNLVLRKLKNSQEDMNYDACYLGKDCHGESLKSGSYYIRDDKGKIIGILCINTETAFYKRMRDYLDSFFNIVPETQNAPQQTREVFSTSISEMVDTILNRTMDGIEDVDRMTTDEKIRVIGELNDEGLFLLKGSVAKTAAALGISEPTAYRYLSQFRKD